MLAKGGAPISSHLQKTEDAAQNLCEENLRFFIYAMMIVRMYKFVCERNGMSGKNRG